MKQSLKSRLAVFTIGILLCCVILEISLRLVGGVYSRLSESEDVGSNHPINTILCLGDSVTFGLGAPRGFSFPDQLQKSLDQYNPEKNYTVINRGWPGQNSAQLLLRLSKYLDEFKPRMAVVLIGSRNQDNFFGFREYLQQSGEESRGFWLSLHDRLDSIRLYKFCRLLIHDMISDKTPSPDNTQELPDIQPGKYPSEVRHDGNLVLSEESSEDTKGCFQAEQYKEMGQYDDALLSLEQVFHRKNADSSCYYLAGSIYLEQKQYEKAAETFSEGIKHDSSFFGNYDGMGLIFLEQNQVDEALKWFKKGFSSARYESLYGHCYRGISEAFSVSGDTAAAIDFFKKEVERVSLIDGYLNSLAGDYLLLFQKKNKDAEVAHWIRSDIEQIITILHDHDVKIILQNYPNEPKINSIYKEIADDFHLPLVDQQQAFKNFTKGSIPDPEYFVADGHPNTRGYQLMADTLRKTIINEETP